MGIICPAFEIIQKKGSKYISESGIKQLRKVPKWGIIIIYIYLT